MSDTGPGPLMRVRDLVKYFDVSPPLITRLLNREGRTMLKAVDGVSFDIPTGRTFSLVGESGCGKSTVARLVVRLYEPTAGSIEFEGVDLSTLRSRREMEPVRERVQMIFQDPYASLNPRWRVGSILAEPLRVFGLVQSPQAEVHRIHELLEQVGLSASDATRFPHEFSGGQRQRISIARALASRPEFIVCDEPTSALDVSVQAQVLNLLKELQDDLGLTYLFITHDLDEALRIGDEIAILRDGEVIQQGDPQSIIMRPADDYVADFIKDINRGRVVEVRSVMTKASRASGPKMHHRMPIEDAIQELSHTGKDTGAVVDRSGKTIGKITMKAAIAAMARPDRIVETVRYK